jgi:BolA protein
MEAIIRVKIDDALRPIHVELVNESSKHNVPKGSESHFKLLVVSDAFEGKSLIERHRLVNSVLKDELQKGIHALSIQAKTPSQHAANPAVSSTPNCLGGSKS